MAMRMASRAWAAFGHDVAMAALSFVLSFYLRVGGSVWNYPPPLIWGYDLAFAATAGAVFLSTGLYRGIWRYASLPDLLGLIKAASLVILVFFPLMFLAGLWWPRELMTGALHTLSGISPLGAAVEAIQDSVQGQFPPAMPLLVLAAYAVVFGFLAQRWFRWE